jgi:hypothetical protein
MTGYFYDLLGRYAGSFSVVLAAIALSSASLWLAPPRKDGVIRSCWRGFPSLSAVEGDAT